MPVVVFPQFEFKRIIRERRERGIDLHDEVWDGVYVMSPEADNQHQKLSGLLFSVFHQALLPLRGVDVYPPINIADRDDHWANNYRCPDVSVFVPGNPAQDRGTYWVGGPDFLVEVRSRGDRSRKKFAFYASVNVREVLFVNRRPWTLELHRHDGTQWQLIGKSSLAQPLLLSSDTTGLVFRLSPGLSRPTIEIIRASDGAQWII